MRFSYAEPINQGRDGITQFKGLNKTLTVQDGEFADMLNMTGDHFPVLSPREKRLQCCTFEKCNGVYGKTHLIWADGETLWYNGARVEGAQLTDSEKTFVGMGAYVLIFPDKQVFSTSDPGLGLMPMGHSFTASGDVSFNLCDAGGTEYTYQPGTKPPDPQNYSYWLDQSEEHASLKHYSPITKEWASVGTTYVKISDTNMGSGFNRYDGVTISGASDSQFNTDHVLLAAGPGYVVVTGLIEKDYDQVFVEGSPPFTISRVIPDMEYFTECNNRVWGCSSKNHEIYACRQGDPFNWRAYEGLSTDSYAVTVGTDGNFTGAATQLGYPVFFKESFIHKIVGTAPSNFSISATEGPGVQNGSHKSLCMVNGLLFYKAVDGVMAYDGATPAEVSSSLGKESFQTAVGGRAGHKYYVSMADAEGAWHMFVFDVKTGLWHREDDSRADWFANCQTDTFFVAENVLWAITQGEKALEFAGPEEGDILEEEDLPALAQPLPWMAETGDMLALTPDNKYISKLQLRLQMDADAAIAVFLQYDSDGEWSPVLSLQGASHKRAFTVPIIPRRCGHLRMKLCGLGGVKVYMISKTLEEGSEA